MSPLQLFIGQLPEAIIQILDLVDDIQWLPRNREGATTDSPSHFAINLKDVTFAASELRPVA